MKVYVIVRQNYDQWAKVDKTIYATRDGAVAALGHGWVDCGDRGFANPKADPEYAEIVEIEANP